jgi:L-lactate dehydrogenase complex protein LldF
VPGKNSYPCIVAAPARRKRQSPGQPGSSDARSGQQVFAQGALHLERLGQTQQLADLYRLFGFFATRLRALTPSNVGPWTQNHSAPKPAARSLHDMAREHLAKQGDR